MKITGILSGFALLTVLLTAFNTVQADPQLLFEAAKKQDWVTVKSLLTQENNVNYTQADGTTALAWTVYWDELDTAKQLIAAGSDINAANYLGVTPLMLAARNRNPDMVSLLLQAGADPHQAMWSGETALMTAARTGVTENISLLLDYGADVNVIEPRRGQNALMWAIFFGHTQAARLLIENGADIHVKTHRLVDSVDYTPMTMEAHGSNVMAIAQGGYNALMFAARKGDIEISHLLLDRGADIDAVSNEDGPALVIATAWGHDKLAMELLERGADPNITDANGMTALHYSMRDGLKYLLGYKLIKEQQVCGFTDGIPCKDMSYLSNAELEQLNEPNSGLTVIDGDTIQIDYQGYSRKVLPGDTMHDLAEALLAHGADVDAKIKYPPAHLRLDHVTWMNLANATPLFLAAAAMDRSAVEIMLEHGADPLQKTEVNHELFAKQTSTYNDDNQILGDASIFMVAIGMGRKNKLTPDEERAALALARRFLELGADINEANITGWTPLHAAAFNGTDSLVKFLVENGARIDVMNGCGRTPLSLAKGESTVGILGRAQRRESTVNLLLDLGAGQTEPSGPVGECVLGRIQDEILSE